MQHEPHQLVQWGHEATERLNHLALTGITDRRSLVEAIQRDLPDSVYIIDTLDGNNTLLVREKETTHAGR